VRLKHTEMDPPAYLSADYIRRKAKDPEVYARRYVGEYEEEENNINSVWEIEMVSGHERGSVLKSHSADGQEQYFRLRHFLTGRVLKLAPSEGNNNIPVIGQQDEGRYEDLGSFIKFSSYLNTPNKELVYNAAYSIGIKSGTDFNYISANENLDYASPETFNGGKEEHSSPLRKETKSGGIKSKKPEGDISDDIDEIPFNPLHESEFNTERKVLFCNDTRPSAENAFIISKVEEEEKKDILFVNSTINRLILMRELTKTQSFTNMNPEILKKTIHALQELILFLHKPGSLTDFYEDDGISIQPRQRLLKDFRIIEILTEILFYPFHLKQFDLKSIPEKFRDLFMLCYRLIKHTIREYRPNEIYSS